VNAKPSDDVAEKIAEKKVTREDIEAKLHELRGEVDERVEEVKIGAVVIAVAVATTAVVVAYWLGRRRSKKRQPVFEIRRI
jgi:hypothetical protein